MKKCLWEMLIPTISNEKKPIRTRFHRVWDAQVRKITGGLTIHNPAKGIWVCPEGKLFAERMIPVRIMCTWAEIQQIAGLTRRYYNQKAIMFYKVSDEVFIWEN